MELLIVPWERGVKAKRSPLGTGPTASKFVESSKTVYSKRGLGDFPGGTVVGNPPANAGDTGSSPGPGGSHLSRSN